MKGSYVFLIKRFISSVSSRHNVDALLRHVGSIA